MSAKEQGLDMGSFKDDRTDGLFAALDLALDRTRALGADAADAFIVDHRSISLSWRLGRQQSIERAESRDIGLRVFVGQRQAIASTADFSKQAQQDLVERAISMARLVPADPYCGLASPSQLTNEAVDIETCDSREPDVELLRRRAAEAEAAALAVQGITNSEGAEANWGVNRYILGGSNGLRQSFARSWHSLSVSVLAGSGTAMERDHDYASAVFAEDLPEPATLGVSAGERAVARLHPRKAASVQVPVVFHRQVANGVLGHLAQAINGSSVARGTTFLAGRLNQRLFGEQVTVIDDPWRRRGLRSRPCDGEGIAGGRRTVVENGVLTTWLLDLRSARQLGLETTGHAARGVSSPPSPSPTNLYISGGEINPRQLISEIDQGLYVMELMGFGVNGVTGNYSRGAAGFWIENGAVAYPVSEVTISGNLVDMFQSLTPADDLEFRYSMNAPTLRIDGMTVAGR